MERKKVKKIGYVERKCHWCLNTWMKFVLTRKAIKLECTKCPYRAWLRRTDEPILWKRMRACEKEAGAYISRDKKISREKIDRIKKRNYKTL